VFKGPLYEASDAQKVGWLGTWLGSTGREIFKTRIGVHYGKTLVGNIGSQNRLNYTVIGDSVNTTARLEAINKQYGTYNIISDEVYEHIKDIYKIKYLDSRVVITLSTLQNTKV
jgi:adenylate cyclase